MEAERETIGRVTMHEKAEHHFGGDFACGRGTPPDPKVVADMLKNGIEIDKTIGEMIADMESEPQQMEKKDFLNERVRVTPYSF